MSKNELDNVSDTARDLFYFVQSFDNKLELCNLVNLWVVEDRIKDLDSVTCGIFQIYFYDNLLNPDKNSKIQNNTKLNKKAIKILLNELFTLEINKKSEDIINEYSNKHDITVT